MSSIASTSKNQLTSDPMVRKNEKEEEIQSEKDDFFANIEEIEMEINKRKSGQMVENCENPRELQIWDRMIIEEWFDGPIEIEVELNMSTTESVVENKMMIDPTWEEEGKKYEDLRVVDFTTP